MAIVPFRRVSKTKKRQRNSHSALTVPGMIVCPNCGELTLSHRACANCGYYKGNQVVASKSSEKSE